MLCWTPDGADRGGTATAIRLARSHGIPVFNLADPSVRARVAATALAA